MLLGERQCATDVTRLAEKRGFEPPKRFRLLDFESSAFDHSATSPGRHSPDLTPPKPALFRVCLSVQRASGRMPLPNRIAGPVMAETRAVFDVTAKNFQADVVERSRQLPVVVLFWADQLPPAKDARRVLETLAAQYQGKFALALSDVSRDQSLAQSLRVQGSAQHSRDPGRPAGRSDGRAARRTRAACDARPVDDDRAAICCAQQLDGVLASGDYATALAMLKQALAAEPNNPAFKLEYADVLVRSGDLDEARSCACVGAGRYGRARPSADAAADDGRSRRNE